LNSCNNVEQSSQTKHKSQPNFVANDWLKLITECLSFLLFTEYRTSSSFIFRVTHYWIRMILFDLFFNLFQCFLSKLSNIVIVLWNFNLMIKKIIVDIFKEHIKVLGLVVNGCTAHNWFRSCWHHWRWIISTKCWHAISSLSTGVIV